MKKKLIVGFGINDADYQVRHRTIVDGKVKFTSCPYYDRWVRMVRRCYSEVEHARRTTYVGTTVCDKWRYFSNFKAWMETQNWEGLQLDKDIILKGSTTYSPETCAFVPQWLNLLLIDAAKSRGEYPIGVHKDPKAKSFTKKPYMAAIGNVLYPKMYLGRFQTVAEAHRAWQKAKIESIYICVERYKALSCYREDVETALIERANSLQLDINFSRITEKV